MNKAAHLCTTGKCTCGFELPKLLAVMTQPVPSGLDVTAIGIMLECPKCQTPNLLAFKPLFASEWDDRDPFSSTAEKPS